jgi:hypothetical protein
MDTYQRIEKIVASMYDKPTTTRKAVGDFMLTESHAVNVKSNNVEKRNYSPNMISIQKLHEWVFEDRKQLSFIFVDYRKANGKLTILNEIKLIPVEKISWECLTIEAQGVGVIQRNKALIVNPAQTMHEFYVGFKIEYQRFLEKEKQKHLKFAGRLIADPESFFGKY